MAAVEMPSDRKLLRSIADGEYQDCLWWGEGEAQRRRFGSGQSVLQLGEKAIVGGVGPDFRWRRWKGLAKELRSELNKRDKVDARDRAEPQGDKEVSWYSVGFGLSLSYICTELMDSCCLVRHAINADANPRSRKCGVVMSIHLVERHSARRAVNGALPMSHSEDLWTE